MKKHILFFGFTLLAILSFSQANIYHPFPDSNAVWVESFYQLNGSMCWIYDDHDLYISGDTTIGNYTYHKLYKSGHVSGFCPPPNPPPPSYDYYGQYWGAFRQDSANKKIYLYDSLYYGKDTLAYDFNLNIGDTLPVTFLNGFNIVTSIDSVLVGNQYNKRFWLIDGYTSMIGQIIEGIGSSYGAFNFIGYCFECGSELGCVKVNNETVYPMDSSYNCVVINRIADDKFQNKISIYPNPFSSNIIITVKNDLKNAIIEIYNIYGQTVKTIKNISGQKIEIQRENLQCGVYFIRLIQGNKVFTTEKVIISN